MSNPSIPEVKQYLGSPREQMLAVIGYARRAELSVFEARCSLMAAAETMRKLQESLSIPFVVGDVP